MKHLSGMFLFGVCAAMVVGSVVVPSILKDVKRDAEAVNAAHATRVARESGLVDAKESARHGTGLSNAQGGGAPEAGVTAPYVSEQYEAELPVMLAETVILGTRPKATGPIAKPELKPKAEMRWLCKEPRDLALGSGAVKECEWSY